MGTGTSAAPALVVAVVAVFAGLTVTAIAGPEATTSKITKKKVAKLAAKAANEQIDARLPLGTDAIADGAVTSGKIADGTVASADLASGSVRASALGPTVLRDDQEALNDGSSPIPEANCVPGERLIAGGASVNSPASDIHLLQLRPTNGNGVYPVGGELVGPPGGMGAQWINPTGGTGNAVAFAYAICLQ